MSHTEQLPTRLRAALEQDPNVNLHSYPVELSIRNDELYIEGEVDDVATKRIIHRHAVLLADHIAIHDRLRRRVDEPRGDAAIRDAVEESFHEESAFRNYRIDVDTVIPESAEEHAIGIVVDGGVLHLSGQVESLTHRRLAEVYAWWHQGVRDVDNRIHVIPPEQDNDGELHDAIRLVLERDPWIDHGQVQVQIQDRMVVVQGLLPSTEQAHMAEHDVWCVRGVHGVDNRIQVTPGGGNPA